MLPPQRLNFVNPGHTNRSRTVAAHQKPPARTVSLSMWVTSMLDSPPTGTDLAEPSQLVGADPPRAVWPPPGEDGSGDPP